MTRWDSGQEDAVISQIQRIVKKVKVLGQEYVARLTAVREQQDAGKYRTVLRIEPVIVGDRSSCASSDIPPLPPTRSIYLSLQVVHEKGVLDRPLPAKIQQIIDRHKGRQKIDLFARRFLNAIASSPASKRLISYGDMYRMLDPGFLPEPTEKPTTISQYLRTLKDQAALVEQVGRYRKGERANEYALTEMAESCFSEANGRQQRAG